jgi:hypothetical protein
LSKNVKHMLKKLLVSMCLLAIYVIFLETVRASPAVPQYHPLIPIKLSYWGRCATFSSPAVPQYLSLFLCPPIFSSSHLKERGRYNSPNTMGTIPTTTFQPYFLLHSYGTHLSYGYLSMRDPRGTPQGKEKI